MGAHPLWHFEPARVKPNSYHMTQIGLMVGFILTVSSPDRTNCLLLRRTRLFYRAAMRKRGTSCRPVSVCLSVCLSHWCIVSRWLKISSNFFSVSQIGYCHHCGFFRCYQISKETHMWGVKYGFDGENSQFSASILLYLGNGTRQDHGCCRTLIGSHR